MRTTSKPHLSGVTSLKFFPSSRVLLSTGLDFSLTILPAELPDGPPSGARVLPVRTLRAHTRPVTDTAIIALGRNIVSASLDATVKLWDVSSGAVLSSLATSASVTSMDLGARLPAPPDGDDAPPPPAHDARELPDTAAKVVFCGLQSGAFDLLDLGFKKSVYTSPVSGSGAITSISYTEAHNLLATGSDTGTVTVYDTRALGTPLTTFRRLDTAVADLAFVIDGAEVGLAVATSDGLPYIASVVPEGPAVHAELVGVDCDPVQNVTIRREGDHTDLWSASDDGVVRRYVL